MKRKKKERKPSGPRYWTKGRCKAEAKKYKTLRDFYRACQSAYRTAMRNGWIEDYVWLERHKRVTKWDDENVLEEAKKYISSWEFHEKCLRGWLYAKKSGAFSKITWFIDSNDEFRKWMSDLYRKVFNLLLAVGVTGTREWLFVESGKADVYTEDQRKLMKQWSERVNEKWAMWKKYKWYYYDDMNYEKRRQNGESGDNMDDGLHIKK